MTSVTGNAADLPAGMTDLEEALRGPDGAARRDEAVERLEAAMRRIHAAVDAGLPSAEHRAALELREGLAVARAILIAFPVAAAG